MEIGRDTPLEPRPCRRVADTTWIRSLRLISTPNAVAVGEWSHLSCIHASCIMHHRSEICKFEPWTGFVILQIRSLITLPLPQVFPLRYVIDAGNDKSTDNNNILRRWRLPALSATEPGSPSRNRSDLSSWLTMQYGQLHQHLPCPENQDDSLLSPTEVSPFLSLLDILRSAIVSPFGGRTLT